MSERFKQGKEDIEIEVRLRKDKKICLPRVREEDQTSTTYYFLMGNWRQQSRLDEAIESRGSASANAAPKGRTHANYRRIESL